MNTNPPITLYRDVGGIAIPSGTSATLKKGEKAIITQSLGGSYTVTVNGNLFRIEPEDADVLGLQAAPSPSQKDAEPVTTEGLEAEVWNRMRTCYDPEIPVNIVDLGLVYDCRISPLGAGQGYRADVKMTLTAPGCGMGPVIAQDVQNKILTVAGIDEAEVELVFEPQWNQAMISEGARLQLGLY